MPWRFSMGQILDQFKMKVHLCFFASRRRYPFPPQFFDASTGTITQIHFPMESHSRRVFHAKEKCEEFGSGQFYWPDECIAWCLSLSGILVNSHRSWRLVNHASFPFTDTATRGAETHRMNPPLP